MSTRLTLICHAPTAATRAARFAADEPLDPEGRAAAARAAGFPSLAAALARAGRRLTAPAAAARETAAALGLPFAVDELLRDSDGGRWTGRGIAEVAAAEPEALAAWMADPAAAPHGGESVVALVARMEGWMAAQARLGGRVAAVTHPALVRAAVVSALGAGAAGFWHVEAAPLTTATLSHDGRRWTLAGLVPP